MPKQKARQDRPLNADDVWAMAVPSQPCISPNGRQIVYVLTTTDRDNDSYDSSIWAIGSAGGRPRRLTSGPRDSSPVWSPDGKSLAFLRLMEEKPPQIYLLPAGQVGGGEARKLTGLPLGAGLPVWSPDSKRIAFAATVDLAGDDRAQDAPVEIDRLGFKADGAGLIKSLRRHVFVVDAAHEKGTARQLTFGGRSAVNPVWSPDGENIAYSSSVGTDVDLSPNVVVHIIPASGGVARAVTPEKGLFQVCDWSHDGSTLLLAGRPGMRPGHDRLYSIPRSGGEPEDLAPGYDRNVMAGAPGYPGTTPRYTGDGDHIYFCARERGAVHLLRLPATGGTPETIAGGARVVAGAAETGGRITFVAAGPSTPGEIWVTADDGSQRSLTNHFADSLPQVKLVEPDELEFSAPDGRPLHGWIIRGSAEGPTPLLVDIHGGPHNAWGPAFDGVHSYHQLLAAEGWTVLIVNPRGSDGYGEDFYTAVCGGWGELDEGDFLAAIDAVVERGLADPDRIAVSGYSYGGYMTCWLTGRHDRFKAAVSGGCVSDLVSLAGTSDMGRHLAEVEIGVKPPAGQDVLMRLSPLTHAAAVTTPTLLLHGEQDYRCPVGQAEQWFSVLRANKVPVEMVRYPGAGHLFILDGKPSHRIDYSKRVASWVQTHAREADRVRTRPHAGDLQARLEELITRYKVPGASVAVLAGGETVAAAAGVLNVSTGTQATIDSIFQIGSISKVYTATVVMQLVEEGLIDLDVPVVEVLPELELADPDVAKTVTMRHLLTHTSGIQGDHFVDTGRGDDCVARFVAACADLGQSHPLGATMSYCNTGYVIAGRAIEVVTGKTWDEAVKERIFEPLGLRRTVTLPEEVLRFAGAVGHISAKPGEDPDVAPVWGLPRSAGPAGLICSTASEVLAFAHAHLQAQLLSADATAAMQEPQVDVPDPYTLGSRWGLGWILFDWNSRHLYGHDGNTIGQSAFLRIVPDEGVAIALLTNGGNAQDLYRELYGSLLGELAGVEMPPRPEPPAEPIESRIDLDQYAGLYERVGVSMRVTVEDGRLVLTTTSTGPLAKLSPEPTVRHELAAVEDHLFVTRQPGMQTWTPVTFYRLADGTPYVHMGAGDAEDHLSRLLIHGGRVIDPSTGFDQVADVLVERGKVADVGADLEQRAGDAARVDATGMVVGPGFVDLHSHVHSIAGQRLQALDGVTTALDLEAGLMPVDLAYKKAADEGRPLNYGFSASWGQARGQVLAGVHPDGDLLKALPLLANESWQRSSTGEELALWLGLLRDELEAGALGIGILVGYAPRSEPMEYLAVARLAAEAGVATFTHVRELIEADPSTPVDGSSEVAIAASETGAAMHHCHVNSTSRRHIDRVLTTIADAQSRGARVTVEAYPYGAGSTGVGAYFLAPERLPAWGITPSSIVLLPSGERIADEDRLREVREKAPGTECIVEFLDETKPADWELLERSLSFPDSIVASDAMPVLLPGGAHDSRSWPLPAGGSTHPRTAGTFAKTLRVMVRETGRWGWLDAFRRASYLPARVLDFVPAAAGKGHLRAGADADIVVIDPDLIGDRATYAEPTVPSTGVRHLFVNGEAVVTDGELEVGAYPGRPLRASPR